MNNRLGIMLILATVITSGCAFIDNNIVLKYRPPPEATSIDKGRICVLPVADDAGLPRNRKGKLVIGQVRNSYGAKTADVLTDDSPTEWIRQALVGELRAKGYDAVESTRGKGVAVDGELVELSNQVEINFMTAADQVTTRLKVRVTLPNGQLREIVCVGRSDNRSPILSESTKQVAYVSSLAITVKDAVTKIDEIISKSASVKSLHPPQAKSPWVAPSPS